MTAAQERATVKRIAQRHHNGWNAQERAHPLDGMSTAEFVAVARAGWPKVPAPTDPYKAARRVLDKHPGEVEFDGV